MVSCTPRTPDEEAIAEFEKWCENFHVAVESQSELDSYIESYEVTWDLPGVDSGFPMSNAAGEEEFTRALSWINSTFGLPEEMEIVTTKYLKKDYSSGYIDVYFFDTRVHRQNATTIESYLLWRPDDGFKLRRLDIAKEE